MLSDVFPSKTELMSIQKSNAKTSFTRGKYWSSVRLYWQEISSSTSLPSPKRRPDPAQPLQLSPYRSRQLRPSPAPPLSYERGFCMQMCVSACVFLWSRRKQLRERDGKDFFRRQCESFFHVFSLIRRCLLSALRSDSRVRYFWCRKGNELYFQLFLPQNVIVPRADGSSC